MGDESQTCWKWDDDVMGIPDGWGNLISLLVTNGNHIQFEILKTNIFHHFASVTDILHRFSQSHSY